MDYEKISPEQAFFLLRKDRNQRSVIDVRSEKEFALGSFPGARNLPILSNEHRHQVGLTYKQQGSAVAIELGHKLVQPKRESMVRGWIEELGKSEIQPGLLFCWRGGLRSQIACQWIAESGGEVLQIAGGFKALRAIALRTFDHLPPLMVIGGMTGSAKSKLLRTFSRSIDLEELAHHRGSAFGKLLNHPQPFQLEFENALALALTGQQGPLLIEDESRLIGHCHLPENLYFKMAESPSVIIESSVSDRSHNIFEEYILQAVSVGFSMPQLEDHFFKCLNQISRKLGGLRTQQIGALMKEAFAHLIPEPEAHVRWIKELLEGYYDRLYSYSLEQKKRPVLFQGSWEECRDWLIENSDRLGSFE